MDAEALYNFIYDWVHGVLPSVEIDQTHQDAPSPKGHYIALSYAGDWSPVGAAPSRSLFDRPDLPSPRIYQWRGRLTIYEVEGNGEYLQQLVESLDEPGIKSSFGDNGVSVLKSTGPTMQPALQDSNWRRESILILDLAWARGHEGTKNYIESVEITYIKPNGDQESFEITNDKPTDDPVTDSNENVVDSELDNVEAVQS